MKHLLKVIAIILLTTAIADAKLCEGEVQGYYGGLNETTTVSWATNGSSCCSSGTGLALVTFRSWFWDGFREQTVYYTAYYIDISDAQYAAGCLVG